MYTVVIYLFLAHSLTQIYSVSQFDINSKRFESGFTLTFLTDESPHAFLGYIDWIEILTHAPFQVSTYFMLKPQTSASDSISYQNSFATHTLNIEKFAVCMCDASTLFSG